MTDRMAAEIFPPGEFVREELEARNWTQLDLAEIIGRPPRLINEIILGKRGITPETAKALSKAFGTSAELWMNLESSWQLSKLKTNDDVIARRAALYKRFPVKEMIRRNWIEDSKDIETLEFRFMQFAELSTLNSESKIAASFRKSYSSDENPLEIPWVYRAKQLAEKVKVKNYSERSLNTCFDRLRSLLNHPDELGKIPGILSDAGIRFLIVEHLAGSKIDGACFWLDKNSPVVALSMRYGRIDYFWFTLMHELRHVANGDNRNTVEGFSADINLVGENVNRDHVSEIEKRADNEACDFLIPRDEIVSFIRKVRPHYYEAKIVALANKIGIHPGIVVGRLQNLGEIPYKNLRKHLINKRSLITATSLTDGWRSGLING